MPIPSKQQVADVQGFFGAAVVQSRAGLITTTVRPQPITSSRPSYVAACLPGSECSNKGRYRAAIPKITTPIETSVKVTVVSIQDGK